MVESVKVSSRYQIAVPRSVRRALGIKRGDRLLVESRQGVILLVPRPASFSDHLAGLHREIWQGVDTDAYLRRERSEW